MKPAIVKWTVDLLAPGAIITPTLTNWYAKWETFHSRRALWPARPIRELLDIAQDGSMALVDFAHVRVTTMMDGYDGATDGPLDKLLTCLTVGEVFDMPRIIGIALTLSQSYQVGFTRAGWVDLYGVDGETVQFIKKITIYDIASHLLP